MYCSNCGAKVQDGANYCHICGHKLIASSTKTSEKTSDKTRVFNPVSLDSINHDDNLKEIVHTLDEKIAKEIYKHTNPESRADFIGPKTSEKNLPEFESVVIDKEDKISPDVEEFEEDLKTQAEENLSQTVQTDKKISDTSEDIIEDTAEPTEENFEVIREPAEKVEDIQDTSEETPLEDSKSQSVEPSEDNPEETEELSEEDVEESEPSGKRKKPFNLINSREFFEKPTDEFDLNPDTFEEEVEEEVEKLKSEIKKKDPTKQKRSLKSIWDSFISERNDEFSIFAEYTNPGIVPGEEQKKKDKKEVVDQTLTNIGNIEQTMPVPIITDEVLKNNKDKKPSPKNSDIKIEQTKETSEKTYSTTGKEVKSKKQSESKKEPKKQNIDDIWLRDDLKDDEELEYNEKEKAFFDEVNRKLAKEERKTSVFNKLEQMGSFPVTLILLLLALVFTLIPLLVGKFQSSIVVLLLLRVVISLIEYFAPLKTAVNKTDLPHSNSNITSAAFLTWAVGALITMIFFFINKKVNVVPSLLAALTPAFVGTVLVCVSAVGISFLLFGKDLKKQDKLSFLGWYAIVFVIIEVLSKIFFLAINFITSAL